MQAVREIQAAILAQSIRERADLAILDVREAWEHKLGTIAQAICLPLAQLPEGVGALGLSKSTRIVTVCHHGVRSQQAARWLMKAGFEQVESLAGGMDAWALQIEPHIGRY